jgi:hypothetical protein
MPHSQHTREIRAIELKQIARQQKELAAIERRLRAQVPEPCEVPPINEEKARRSARLEQNRRHQDKHRGGTPQK